MSLDFYKALKYPVPNNKEFFIHQKKQNWPINDLQSDPNVFSRDIKSDLMTEFITHIDKYHRLYKSIPWVRAIFLCNSITFNALHDNSDIDLFIISKKNRIRRAKFWSTLLFTIFWLKRLWKSSRKKFCLSFLISEDWLNLQKIYRKTGDIYLPYWIWHLTPLYADNKSISQEFIDSNWWIKHQLPNHPLKFVINIWNKQSHWSTFFKKLLDSKIANFLVSLCEKIISSLWIPIIKLKMSLKKEKHQNIVLTKTMLKFHKDKRRQYYFLFKKQRKSQR